ncbi:S8 family serine peptidase [Nocardioides mesophilus]|uniref:S8 family serine peptidase n=1 Tax=Nocardioides mesophilus TaxID=433659 RepID=A0A7G9R7J7_9ACTN|nr:S8 family serine peptidase [Nocardioides mesophilus]QNN51572.1 S8 family serine peptidase [Nocardioides mesophilus]
MRMCIRRLAGAAVALAVVCPAALATVGSASAAPARAPGRSPVTSTVVVTLAHGADLSTVSGPRKNRLRAVVERLRQTADRDQAPLIRSLSAATARGEAEVRDRLWISNSLVLTATADVVAQVAARPEVASVVPDAVTLTPAETASANQVSIRSPEVWSSGDTGAGIVVATLDSGVDVTHPDLAGSWRGGTNSWFDPYAQHPTTPTDLMGHGTGVTGVMVGGSTSGTAIGTAPGATWIAARVFDDAGRSTVSAVHRAFQWLLDPDADPNTADAPRVVDASWSLGTGPGCDLTFQPDVQALRSAGILPVFPAGNFGSTTSSSVSPANYPESLSVGAVSATGLVMSSSSRGPSTCGGRTRAFPDLVAPGGNVLTADRYGLYQYLSGTSVAAPHAAGVLALLLAESPALSADQQQALITGTAADRGVAGVDEVYGHGMLDAAAAYAAGLAPPPPPPTPAADLGLTLTTVTGSADPGATASWQVQTTGANGFTADVDLSVTGPATSVATVTLTPRLLTGGSGTSTLTLVPTAAATAGTYGFTVTATGGGLTRTADGTLQVTAPPPPPPPPGLTFSTLGNANPPGAGGTADDADLYRWDGSSYARTFDASLAKLPGAANVDGLDLVDPTHFFVSFSGDVTVPGLGTVQDEDVLSFSAGTWSVYFDGTARGLTSSGQDLDAISVDGGTLSFSTVGSVKVPGVGGTADDADIYSWDGSTFARVWDASVAKLPSAANVDGFVRVDATHFYASFATDVTIPGLGTVQDEDVVGSGAGTWSVYFDGTAHGLTSSSLDIDAFDVG